MISAMGVLYSRISPTIFGFEATTQANNQEFVMFSVANAVTDLVSSPEDAQNRVKIISKDAIYSVNAGHLLAIQFLEGGAPMLNDTSSEEIKISSQIGSFTANVSASFQGRSGTFYYGKNFDEDSYINENTTDMFNFVSKVQYVNDEALFSLYFRSRIHVSEQLPNNEYDITIIVIKLIFQSGPTYADFPVTLDEWSLRLRRSPSNITTFTRTSITGPITISQIVDGVNKTTLSVFDIIGADVNIKYIEVPILLTI